MNLCVVIPALEPDRRLRDVVTALSDLEFSAIIVVNDGSGPEFDGCFDSLKKLPRVHVLRTAVNLGKGAALKTGISYAMCNFPDQVGVVTADADGQHDPGDIVKVAERLLAEPKSLILGVRSFAGGVPLRSKFGNIATRCAVRLLIGHAISDTQTGLRGIPAFLLPWVLRIAGNGYEFELDMLTLCRRQECRVVEEPIRTIYLDQNRASHFNPLWDSMRIYFVLIRFAAVSMTTALIDNLMFLATFSWTTDVIKAQIAGRGIAVLFNFWAARRAVFLVPKSSLVLLSKYLLLVLVSGVASYAIIRLLHDTFSVPVFPAKLIAESVLFFANFAVQRDFVFTSAAAREKL
jgi:glycosyltransferase involved in cell wall biosynthesis